MALEATGALPDRLASATLADVSKADTETRRRRSPATKAVLIAVALLFLALFLILPLVAVFVEALRKGAGEFFASFGDPDTLSADPAHAARRGDRGAAQHWSSASPPPGRSPSSSSRARPS